MARTWIEKLHEKKDLPKVVPIAGNMIRRFGRGKIVIPSALCVDARMRRVPKGKLTTIDGIRDSIAAEHKADVT